MRDAILGALLAAGSDDRRLADEIAAVVELFLEKTFFDEIPGIEQIEDMVEKVLVDTGHAAAAKAFILHRDRRRRLREARDARHEQFAPTLFDNRVLRIDDAASGRSTPFSRARLARSLSSDGGVPREVADDVAADVEVRLRNAAVQRAPASLVHAITEVELLDRATPVDLRRRAAALIPGQDLAAAVYRRSREGGAPVPAVASRELGAAALRCHALSDLLPADVARAHLDGELHVHGLGSPTSLDAATLRPDDIVSGVAPGSGPRAPAEAARSGRRLASALGRATRHLGAAVVCGVRLRGMTEAFAALHTDASRDEVAEDAWQLLLETAADPGDDPAEIDLTPRGGAATEFAAALLRAHARRDGLPARELLAVPTVVLGDAAFGDAESREVLRLAADAVLRGARVRFQFERDAPSSPSAVRAGRITLNLPQAARRVGRGNVEGFLRACDALVDTAMAGHVARRELLSQVAGAPGGTLAPLLRGGRGRRPFIDLSAATWSVGITGLNEAVAHLSGFELHEGDEDVLRVARRIVSYLSLRVKEAGLAVDVRTTLDADESADVAARLFAVDGAEEPGDHSDAYPEREAYTPGVAVRETAPVDLLDRVECEEPLHASLSAATLRLRLEPEDLGGPDGLVALLRKLLRTGTPRAVEIVTW